jgi:hypothetical protein
LEIQALLRKLNQNESSKNTEVSEACDPDCQLPKIGAFYHEVNLQVGNSEILLASSAK